jgi:hypothetical protein
MTMNSTNNSRMTRLVDETPFTHVEFTEALAYAYVTVRR